MVALNGRVRILSRAGVEISSVTLNAFFQSRLVTPQSYAYDPKLFYDPGAQRWVLVACADADRATASFLISASTTSDPTGTWRHYSFDVDAANQVWNDYPSVGFNKDWIAVSFNMFFVGGDSASHGFTC
jgi:hypothetical protein